MAPVNHAFRDRISAAVSTALQPLRDVLAGWEGGSAAFGALDEYSDIDLNFLTTDGASLDELYGMVDAALQAVSPVTASHVVGHGRYYKLQDSDDYLLLDVCFIPAGASDHRQDLERHGRGRRLFDKGNWLRPRATDESALGIKRRKRYEDLKTWFPVSQSFVRKAILRGQQVEALASYWSYTLRPLAELLRKRYCPVRWDFGLRYLDRDLPPAINEQFNTLAYLPSMQELSAKCVVATTWGATLLDELGVAHDRRTQR